MLGRSLSRITENIIAKKRREFVEHIRVRQVEFAYRIEITQHAESTEKAAPEKIGDILFRGHEPCFIAQHHDKNKNQRNKIPEKRLLKRGQISRELDEHRHQRKAERRQNYIENTFCF